MIVYILTRDGPGWSNIIGVYSCKPKAVLRAAQLNAKPDAKRSDIFDRLSSYHVRVHRVIE